MNTILIVYVKEVLENLRDKRTVINSLLMGPLIGPVLMMGMLSFMLTRELDRAEAPLKLPVAGAEFAPNLVAFLRQHAVEVMPAPADPEAAVKNQDQDLVLRIPKDFAEHWRRGEAAPVELVFDASQRDSNTPIKRTKDVLDAYGHEVGALRLLARGIHPGLVNPIVLLERDQSTAISRAGVVLAFLPYIMMLGAFIGGMYLAIDTTAGERERRSLEPLLATPNPPSRIMLGKLAATATFAMTSLILTLIAFALLFPRLPLDKLDFRIDFGLLAALKVLGICAPVVLMASALQTLIAAYAKSHREAQSYLQFVMFVPMLPSLVVMVMPLKVETWMMATPLLAQNLAINKLLRGEYISPLHYALSVGVTLLLGAVLVAVAAQLYRREELAVSA
jgi:sodium transport system permease protein